MCRPTWRLSIGTSYPICPCTIPLRLNMKTPKQAFGAEVTPAVHAAQAYISRHRTERGCRDRYWRGQGRPSSSGASRRQATLTIHPQSTAIVSSLTQSRRPLPAARPYRQLGYWRG